MKDLQEKISKIFGDGCYILAEVIDERGCRRLIETKDGKLYRITYADYRYTQPVSLVECK